MTDLRAFVSGFRLLAFVAIAAGQALGAPLVGVGSDALGLGTVCYVSAGLALAAAGVVRPEAPRAGG